MVWFAPPFYRTGIFIWLLRELRHHLSECNHIPAFDYCEAAWRTIKTDRAILSVLRQAITVGHVANSEHSKALSRLGLLLPKKHGAMYVPVNNLVKLFVRQRLSELGEVLPLTESSFWLVPSLNEQAYRLLLQVENSLRSFIGDQLYLEYRSSWLENGIKPVTSVRGKPIYDETIERLDQEKLSPFSSEDAVSSFLQYLEISDLVPIITYNEKVFSDFGQLLHSLPVFMEEINYLRRRVAHGRSVTEKQIDGLQQRWDVVQKMMRKK